MDGEYVRAQDALAFVHSLEDGSVDLAVTDPPYFQISKKKWDRQWKDLDEYVEWLTSIFFVLSKKMKPSGSLLFFGAIGSHGSRPLFRVMDRLESHPDQPWYSRNFITWKKKRAYGKEFDYLFCREEIVWYSCSSKRTSVTFNKPLLAEKRGYAGFNERYAAKSEYKRVSNVWSDITELFKPKRECQKPEPLIERIVAAHSNPGDLVVDMFAGYGTTGIVAHRLGRRFLGCEIIPKDAGEANERCAQARH